MNDSPKPLTNLSLDEKRLLLRRLLEEKKREQAATEFHPLSYGQQALWSLYQLEPGSTAYTIFCALQFTAPVNKTALHQALEAIITRHAILRTTYVVRDGIPYQQIHPMLKPALETHSVAYVTPAFLREQASNPFDLEKGPVLRLHLYHSLQTEQDVLLLVFHHIAIDLWSLELVIQDLETAYKALSSGRQPAFAPVRMSYLDYTYRQRKRMSETPGKRLGAYWTRQLQGAPPVLQLPLDSPRPPMQTYQGARYSFTLDAHMTQHLRELAKTEKTTLYTLLLTAFATLLYRYTNQKDILIGSPTAGRDEAELAGVIGYLVNPVVLRAQFSEHMEFRTLLSQMRVTVAQALEHGEYPFPLLVKQLQITRDPGRSPLFQVAFSLEKEQQRAEHDAAFHILSGEQLGAEFDLTLQIFEGDEHITACWRYNSDLFREATMARMAGHFQELLKAICASPNALLDSYPLLSAAEQQRMLRDWNKTTLPYPEALCMHHLFEQQVEQTPQATALICGTTRLTYQQLNQRANQLARLLQHHGVGPEVPVGIYLPRTEDIVVALLATLKAGGTYIPLDPAYPAERIRFILQDSRASIVLTRSELAPIFQQGCTLIRLDERRERSLPMENLTVSLSPESLAYSIYTSGSTGLPKGVALEHRNAVAFLTWVCHAFSKEDLAGVAVSTSICFDLSIFEIFAPLSCGGAAILTENALQIPDAAARDEITLINTVPSAIAALVQQGLTLERLRIINLAGEPLQARLVDQLYKELAVQQVNDLYGPSECTTYSTYTLRRQGKPPTIGRPISNTRIYILNEQLQAVPPGVVGELYIGGAGVSRGYLHRPELTAERFLPDPYNDGKEGARMYRTGDLARFTVDGEIEFLGRADLQIKIRGYRIELEEIEHHLSTFPGLKEGVVMVKELAGGKQLVAYVVPETGQPLASSDIRAHLLQYLPDYMIPALFIQLQALPLTANGKIDRQALPEPEAHESEKLYTAPRTKNEQILAEIWAEVLGVERVGINETFFELGGDSILSMQVVSKARSKGLHFTSRDIFRYKTIAELAVHTSDTHMLQAEQGVVVGRVPLTPIGHWFFEQHFTNPHHWNQALLLQARQPLDNKRLQKAVACLQEHHDALRLRFQLTANGWEQSIAEAKGLHAPYAYVDLSPLPAAQQESIMQQVMDQLQTSINLENGPLFWVVLFHFGEGQPDKLFFTAHHLAVDGVSWRILLEDIQTAYSQSGTGTTPSLPAKTTSLKQWAERLQIYAQDAPHVPENQYWFAQVGNNHSHPLLPIAHPGGSNTEGDAHTVSVALSTAVTHHLLHTLPRRYRIQPEEVQITALALALSASAGRETIVLDLEGHGREHLFDECDLARTVGWFTSLYPVHLSLSERTPVQALKQVRAQLQKIPQRGMTYGILRYLSGEKQLAQLSTSEVLFNYLGHFDLATDTNALFETALSFPGNLRSPDARRSHILEINTMLLQGQLHIHWTCSKHQFSHDVIAQLARDMLHFIEQIVSEHSTFQNIYTLADFPLIDLSQQQLDHLVYRLQQGGHELAEYAIEELLPLSPSLQGMLLSSLTEETDKYREQFVCTLHGSLSIEQLQHRWHELVSLHAALRSSFVWDPAPLQVIWSDRPASQKELQFYNWLSLPSAQQDEALQKVLATERERCNLSIGPLITLTLCQLDEAAFKLVLTYHHLVLDGWSLSLLLDALFAPALPTQSAPYNIYMRWLQKQDLTAAEHFWRSQLAHFTQPTCLGVEATTHCYAEQTIQLDAEGTHRLQTTLQRQHITLNTLFQGLWALLLAHYLDRDDIAFGVTTAGRPAEIAGIETIIGCFINTILLRLNVQHKQDFWSWLAEIQESFAETQQFQYCSAGQIHQWSDVPATKALYDSILVFENYPLGERHITSRNLTLHLRDAFYQGARTEYALTLMILPGSALRVRAIYDRERLDEAFVEHILQQLTMLLRSIADRGQVQDLFSLLPAETRGSRKVVVAHTEKAEVATPQTQTERRLATIWQQTLGLEMVDTRSNFFMLGGHSLLATALIDRIQDEFQVSLSLTKLFAAPTIVEQAQEIDLLLRSQQADNSVNLPELVPAPQERFQPFPLTDVQYAYWVGQNNMFALGNTAAHLYAEVDAPDLDLELFQRCWQRLIERHEMLRMIVTEDGQQRILADVPSYKIQTVDLRDHPDRDSELKRIREEMAHHILPAERWPLFDIRASLLNDHCTRLHFSFDLLICDAFSLQIISRELTQLYQHPESELPALDLSFRDYILHERALRSLPVYTQSLAYWRQRLSSLPPAPVLPLVKQPEEIERPRFQRRSTRMSRTNWQRLKTYAMEEGLTPSTLLLAAFARTLASWCNEDHFTLNLTIFHRLPLHPQVNEVLGDFTSLILLEVAPQEQLSFLKWAKQLQLQLWQDLDNRYVSGVQVLRELAQKQQESGTLFMPVVFTSVLPPTSDTTIEPWLGKLGTLTYSISQTPQVWLDHQVTEENGELVLLWDAVEELFPPGLLDDMFSSYCTLLQTLGQARESWNRRTPHTLLPLPQQEMITSINTIAEQPEKVLLHTPFLQQVRKRPEHVSLITAQRSFSYLDLYTHAYQLSQQLKQHQVRPNTLIAIVMEKGWEQIVATLGVLFAGAAYLPIDARQPQERIHYMLEHGDVPVVLTQPQFKDRLSWPEQVHVLAITDDLVQAPVACQEHAEQEPEDIAYVIYTSGSTGHPKGVVIDHQAAMNTILDINRRFQVTEQDRVFALSSLSFDLSVYDIFGALAAGATIVLPQATETRDPAAWCRAIQQHRVTIWNSVPALMSMLVEYAQGSAYSLPQTIRLVLLSGDWIPLSLPEQITALFSEASVISLGGATEASIWSIYYPITSIQPEWKSIPYGKPLTNQQFYVFNKAFELCPTWVPGQLYIGGHGLAQGYWRDSQKTHASFIRHPVTGERLYKTGDLGRYLPDGNIEFLGREDFQVKVGGYRIEPGEIEAALVQLPEIDSAIVTAVGEQFEHKRLLAYVIPAQQATGSAFDWNQLQACWQEHIHTFSIPSVTPEVIETEQKLEEVLVLAVCKALRDMGVYHTAAESYTLDELMEVCKIHPRYRKWLTRNMALLTKRGLLVQTRERFEAREPLPATDITEVWHQYHETAAKVTNQALLQLGWLEHVSETPPPTVTRLSAILREDVHSAEIYVSSETVASYRFFHYCNLLARQITADLVQHYPAPRKLRVLEVGAGFGTTTEYILPAFPAERTNFVFTDISRYFLQEARTKFAHYPFMTYDILNIEENPQAQGYDLHSFDLIIASSVLHATARIEQSLAHIRSLLAPNGLLLLLEETAFHPSFDLAMGLQQGFDRFEDTEIRWPHPLLSRAQWAEILKKQGFQTSINLHQPGSITDYFGLDLILAQGPNTVRTLQSEHILESLRKRLPEYMLPTSIIPLERFPLTANGKVDRKRLPLPAQPARQQEVSEAVPRSCSPTEARLIEIWCDLLDLERVALDANFFQLGGDSLLATRLLSRIRSVFDLELPLQSIFSNPTISMLATKLDQQKKEKNVPSSSITTLASQTRNDLLKQIDQLSADEVRSLLKQMLTAKEENE
ncbi:non-ribosomal peptide synthase protein (TIGR01720 family)/amino acid adenylation domain-containing protein [Thermosporothrix hazakensis]|jgi:amino acid adenylation domain-containing protein/non-ribosomal peptide synthase protein (TIGR01720 family)|uniref:Non-ribosomal peptide synthase protein (TIGR01720 family)/amino acid adenylation domain-containing protein n=1 Tax=Thermosporothrix hazakensis TaxID=644383 RepID=A0A326UFT3_THEHA|nr:non-ribosomal peptide synthetase [Thermosporothrix hazakensis]PZW26079.1 non-ribosomal peptide synthase protein (TIGR01720 family)/amino acid adenylation domain-containing protein [Thermosporothrix hazakensis]GCE51337.1 hypothetical protein KTH_62060 [Thermosporothrix hazakensis]